MASTYSNTGIELIGVGEQSNTWGQTTNTNWRLVEELATGVVSISLNGLTSYSLTATDGVTSNGRHLVIEFTGAPGATCTVTVNPDDLQKVYIINNATDQTITVTQGTGADVDVPAGTKKIIYCDGAGAGAAVTDLTENLSLSGEVNTTAFSINDTEVTATADELNVLDGITASTAELNVLDGVSASTDEINKLDGFTGVAADLNYAKDLRATGVTTTEFDKLDGLTASTADLNTASTHYVPSGGIIMWSGSISSVPAGWTFCDGSNGTPDLRDRFIVGAGGSSFESYDVNDTGGSNFVSLREFEMPSHNHSMQSAGDHNHGGNTGSGTPHNHDLDLAFRLDGNHFHEDGNRASASPSPDSTQVSSSPVQNESNHTHSISSDGNHTHIINNTGGGFAHENRPPYYALAYIMKL